MKRLAILLAIALLGAGAIGAEPIPIAVNQPFTVPTSLGPATAIMLPAGNTSYLVLTLPGEAGKQTVIPLVVAPMGVIPEPQPGPSPGPTPTPAPAGKVWLFSVTETKDQTPDQASVLNSEEAEKYIASKGWAWRKADKDVVDQNGQVPSDLSRWLERAKGKPLPYLIAADDGGMVIHEGPLPATAADLVALLKRLGGDAQ